MTKIVEPFYALFGEAIKTAREKKGMSGETLGALIGVSRQVLSNWETGANRINTHHAIAVAGVLDMDLNAWRGCFKPAEWKAPCP